MCDITHDLQITSPITNCHIVLDPGFPWRMTYFMDDLQAVIRSIAEDQERHRQTDKPRDRQRGRDRDREGREGGSA